MADDNISLSFVTISCPNCYTKIDIGENPSRNCPSCGGDIDFTFKTISSIKDLQAAINSDSKSERPFVQENLRSSDDSPDVVMCHSCLAKINPRKLRFSENKYEIICEHCKTRVVADGLIDIISILSKKLDDLESSDCLPDLPVEPKRTMKIFCFGRSCIKNINAQDLISSNPIFRGCIDHNCKGLVDTPVAIRLVKNLLEEIRSRETSIVANEKLEPPETTKPECPIDHAEFVDPVMVPCCGQSFNRSSLWEWLRNNPSCPTCRKHLSFNVELAPNNVALCDALGIDTTKKSEKEEIIQKPEKIEFVDDGDKLQFLIQTALRNDLSLALDILRFVKSQNMTLKFEARDLENVFLSDSENRRYIRDTVLNIGGTRPIFESIISLMERHTISPCGMEMMLMDHHFNLDLFDGFVSLFDLHNQVNIPDNEGKTVLYRLLEDVPEANSPSDYRKKKIEKVTRLAGLNMHVKCQEKSFLDVIVERDMVWAMCEISGRLKIDEPAPYIQKANHRTIKSKLTEVWFGSLKNKIEDGGSSSNTSTRNDGEFENRSGQRTWLQRKTVRSETETQRVVTGIGHDGIMKSVVRCRESRPT
jgi:hypothetical protein